MNDSDLKTANGLKSETKKLVVGFDGSPNSIDALRWALNEAHERNFNLEIIYSWLLPGSLYPFPVSIPNTDDLFDQAKQFIEDQLRQQLKEFPDIKVTLKFVEGPAGQELVNHGKATEGIVVGATSHDTFSRLLIGSVSHYVVVHAECPVIVVKQKGKE